MKLYTVADLNKGAGVFDHMMRTANEYPSHHREMPTPVAIGVLAAAYKSGLNNKQIAEVIEGYFNPETADLLAKLRAMYTGDDNRVHLWRKAEEGERLDCSLSYYSSPDWQLDRYHR